MGINDPAALPGLEDLPNAPRIDLHPNLSLQPPLSRLGHGPGLILIDPGYDLPDFPSAEPPSTTLDPAPQYKWAEEGYAVLRIQSRKVTKEGDLTLESAWSTGLSRLNELPECDTQDKFVVLVFGAPDEYSASFVNDLRSLIDNQPQIVATVTYTSSFDLASSARPQLVHQPSPESPTDAPTIKAYHYPDASSSEFVIPHSAGFNYSIAAVSHTRSLTFVKKHLDGPYFDLEKIWDEHTYWEFENRSVEKTMATMVREPYVNHIPTMTGGIGRKRLTDFYRDHFIWQNPDDIKLNLVSRTIGVDRIVDEFISCFTHDKEIDWLIPGIPPTGLFLQIPTHAVVNIRGDRLYHEHIGWDQSSVLRQMGMLPEYLPFPHTVPGLEGKVLECKAPVAGVETANKMTNQRSVESNTLFMPHGKGIRVRKEGC